MGKEISTINIFFLFLQFLYFSAISIAQTPGEWTWMTGNNTANAAGVFGTQGVPNAANTPPALYAATTWIDNNGNFWLFGGMRNTSSWNGCNALWKYDVATNLWTWMKGSSFPGAPGVYGVKGVPAPANTPGQTLFGTASWTDAAGDLWLFGGEDISIGYGPKNDLWKYTIATNEWTWMGGSIAINVPDITGTMGVASATTWPGGRVETTGLGTDVSGNLWLYAGQVNGGSDNLWKYDVGTNQWTWMKGANTFGTPAVYGTQGVSSTTNTPGAIYPYASWSDIAGGLWIFGGLKPDNLSTLYTNTLWKYTIATNEWTWVKGANTTNDPGSYGSKCIATPTNNPPARWENRARVKDACGNFWTFGGGTSGGLGFNDLWHYNTTTNQWTWMSGSNLQGQAAVYGTKGVSAATNQPGGRFGGVSWIDKSGYIYIFGGFGTSVLDTRNELFRYVPPNSFTPTQTNSTTCNPCNGSATVTFNCALPNYSYVWSNGSSTLNTQNKTSTVTGLCPGTYTVTLTSGCIQSQTAEFTITGTVCGNITANVNSSNICEGASSCPALTATGTSGTTPYTYTWSTGATTQNINPCPLTTTAYTVTIIDNAGVTASTTAIVTVYPTVTSTLTVGAINCSGASTGSITATGSGGTSPFTFSWSNLVSGSVVSGLTAGTYTVTVTDNKGCTATTSATLVAPPILLGKLTKGTATCTNCGCQEWILVNATGGTSPYSYSWSDGYDKRYKNRLCPGTYTINITDKNNCSVNVNLTAP